MKVRKVQFSDDPKCNKELFPGRKDIPVCVKRIGLGIHTDFRPVKPYRPQGPLPPSFIPKQPTEPLTPPEPPNLPPPISPPNSKSYVGEIIGAIAGTAGLGASVISALTKTEAELIEPEIEMVTAESATTGTSTAYESLSEAGLRNRFGASAVEGESAEITAITEEGVGALEIAGEATEAVAVVGAGSVAGLIAGAGAVATGAVVSLGALGYFVNKGLFDFNSQSASFQKGPYNLSQEVSNLQPPKLEYVPPPSSFASTEETITYFQAQSKAQETFNTEMNAYQDAIKSVGPIGPVGPVPVPP